MQDVANAAEQTFQEAEISEDDRWRIFLDVYKRQQQQLAELVKVSRQTISAIEKGDYNPTINLCIATVSYTHLDITHIPK